MSNPKRVDKTTPLNTLMRFDFDSLPLEYHSQYPFSRKDVFLFLGEIQQMPGHCVVATKDGRITWGYHTENFVVISNGEV